MAALVEPGRRGARTGAGDRETAALLRAAMGSAERDGLHAVASRLRISLERTLHIIAKADLPRGRVGSTLEWLRVNAEVSPDD